MHLKLTDGIRTLEMRVKGASLDEVESSALRLIEALTPPPDTPTPHDQPGAEPESTGPRFGFSLDGTTLGSDTERVGINEPSELQHPRDSEPDGESEP